MTQRRGLKIVIVGGVAGGAGAAAKARRVDEHAEILVFERGPYVSFANCGLPYYVGGEIEDRRALLLQTPESFWKRFRVDVRVRHEVSKIDRAAKKVEVRDLAGGRIFWEAYDKLILAPGAGAIVPDLPGIQAPNVFTVKTVPDSDAVKTFIAERAPRRAVVVGAGFIGLETAEALKRRGLEVSVVEMLPQVLPPFDADMASFVARHLEERGVSLHLSDGLKAFHGAPLASEIELQSGRRLPLDMAILSIGVRPELKLARESGLRIGETGGIAVDERQRTSDPDIFAAGDAVEVVHLVTGRKARIPLAGPANKQGRVAGANAAGAEMLFPGALGTAIVECLGLTAAKTGLSEREAAQAGISSFSSFTHAMDHAGYYPGAEMMHMKLVVETGTGRLLGAQIVGERGVDKRIDVLATALSAGLKVTDLENLDLAYAPQFSSAKDPVVMAGFTASNLVRGETRAVTCGDLAARLKNGEDLQLVDVRTPEEYAAGHLPGARSIPLDDLRGRLGEISPDKEVVVYCKVGFRGYLAARILEQSGFTKTSNLSGGILVCRDMEEGPAAVAAAPGGQATVDDLRRAREEGRALLMDVREADEYFLAHVAGTSNVPLSRLDGHLPSLPRERDIYVFCQTGVRTAEAARKLRAAGFTRVRPVAGGLSAWTRAGYPVERRKGPIPIMRQVQIVAGALALTGGLFPALRWVAVVVGAGLVFAGVSGLCGMAKVLSRLPWNRQSAVPDNAADGCGPCGVQRREEP